MADRKSWLGAVASGAGDDFHYWWSAREILRLLDPADDLAVVTVEGLPDGADEELGEHGQVVDVTLRHELADGSERWIYQQLKYSPTNPTSPWTWARMLRPRSSKKPGSSVLARLAALMKDKGFDATFSIVTNQPLHADVESDIREILHPSGKGSTVTATYLAKKLKLTVPELSSFLKIWDLSGFESCARLELEFEVTKNVSGLLDGDARKDAAELHRHVAQLMLPEAVNSSVTRQRLLLWLGVGAEEKLYPAPSRITPPTDPVIRPQTAELVGRLLKQCSKPIRVHADGGCGKTALMTSLQSALPEGSEVFIYDCYGGGLFLASDHRRHHPKTALTQVSNEIAARLRTPFVLRVDEAMDALPRFVARARSASSIIADRNADARLVIVFDAVDNARIGAKHWEEPCFLDEVVGVSEWPENVRIVVTGRNARLPQIGNADDFEDMPLDGFAKEETCKFVLRRRPEWSIGVAEQFHELTGGNPRRLTYALDGIGSDEQDKAIERLQPRAQGIDPLFEKLVKDAGARLGSPALAWEMLSALARLPRPVPADVLAAVAGLQTGDVADIANDVGGMTEHETGWSFHDEDFEGFVDARTEPTADQLLNRAADLLLSNVVSDTYAARSIGEVLVAAKRNQALYDLVISPNMTFPPSLSDVEKQHIASRRLALSVRTCRSASDVGTATRLLISSAEALKRQRLIEDVIVQNLDLSVRFETEAALRLVMTGSRHRKARAAYRIHSADAAREVGKARQHLAWWDDHLTNGERAHPKEIAAEYSVIRRYAGEEAAWNDLLRWRDWKILLGVLPVIAGQLAGRDCDSLLSVLAQRTWSPFVALPLLATAILAGADLAHPTVTKTICKLASHAGWARKPLRDSGVADLLHWREAAVFVCERALTVESLHDAVDSILTKALPVPGIVASHQFHSLGAIADQIGRMLAIREFLAGNKIDASTLVPAAKTYVKEPKTREERDEAEEVASWNKSRAEALTKIEFAQKGAQALCKMITSGSLDESLLRSICNSVPTYHRHQSNDERLFVPILRAHFVHAALSAIDIVRIKACSADLIKRWMLLDRAAVQDLAEALALVEAGHDAAGELLVELDKVIDKSPGVASETAKLQTRSARIALPLDIELSRFFFAAAIESTRRVDTEAYGEMSAANAIASSGLVEAQPERARLAKRYAETVGAVAVALDVGGDLPWARYCETVCNIDLNTGLLVLSHWHDAGLVDFSWSLPALLSSKSSKQLTDWQRYALSMLAWHDRPELDEIFNSEDAPFDIAETEFERSINCGDMIRAHEALEMMERQGPIRQITVSARATFDKLSMWRNKPADEDYGKSIGQADPIDSDQQLREALGAIAETERGGTEFALFSIASRIVRANLRLLFLEMSLGMFGNEGEFGRALPDIFELWPNYPPLQAWAKKSIPGYLKRSLRRLWDYNYRETVTLDGLLSISAVSEAEQADMVMDAIVENSDELNADELFSLIGVIASRAPASDRAQLLEALLERLSGRANTAPKVSFATASAPEVLSNAVALFLFGALGDLDRRIAWAATHALVLLGERKDQGFEPLVAQLQASPAQTDFLPANFYLHSAWENLMFGLWRVAEREPATLGGSAAHIVKHLESNTHVVIREAGRRLLLTLQTHGALHLAPSQNEWLARLNRTQLPPLSPQRPAAGHFHPVDVNRGRKFDFDTTDTIPYWYRSPARFFDMTQGDFLTQIEKWICTKWRYDDQANRWDREPRLERLRDLDNLTSHRHGSRPIVFRLSRYLEWHGMMCAVGELIGSHPMVAGTYPHFEEWLDDLLPTNHPNWAVDARTPPPLEPRFWGRFEDLDGATGRPTRGSWTTSVRPELFDAETVTALGGMVVAGKFAMKSGDQSQHVTVRSALVTPESATALAQALVCARDHMDFLLPGLEDHAEIDADGFKLEGWLHFNEDDPRADRPDPMRGVDGIPVRLDRKIGNDLDMQIVIDPKSEDVPNDGRTLLLRNWMTEDHGEGWRLTTDAAALVRLVEHCGRSLIMSVEISRRVERSTSDTRPATRWAIYLYDPIAGFVRVNRPRRSEAVWLLHAAGIERNCPQLVRWMLHRVTGLNLAFETATPELKDEVKASRNAVIETLRQHLCNEVYLGRENWNKIVQVFKGCRP